MEIQRLTYADAAAYQRLRLFALRESPAAFGSSYAEEVDRPLEVVAERLMDKQNHVFGAFTKDGQLIGVATLRRDSGEKRNHKAFVFGMYVSPEHRHQGAGRALMEAVIARAREIGVRQVNLTVNNTNEAAYNLYESCGFKRFGLEEDAFKVGEDFFDEAYMALRLRN